MKINLNAQLKGIDGKYLFTPMKQTAEEFIDLLPNDLKLKIAPFYAKNNLVSRTVKQEAINAISTPINGDDEQLKLKKYFIYKKLFESEEDVELISEEITILKSCIGKTLPQLIMGQCFEVIEGTNK